VDAEQQAHEELRRLRAAFRQLQDDYAAQMVSRAAVPAPHALRALRKRMTAHRAAVRQWRARRVPADVPPGREGR
jgi:hypothetical protein